MYTKQEKLAAARKKLKEFQGKQRENDMNRAKCGTSPINYNYNRKDTVPSSITKITSQYKEESSVTDQQSHFQSITTNSPEISDRENENSLCTSKKGNESLNNFECEHPSIPVTVFEPVDVITQTLPCETTSVNSDLNPNMNKVNYEECQNVNHTQLDYFNGLINSDTVQCNNLELVQEDSDNEKSKPKICTFFKDSTGSFLTEVEFNANNTSQREKNFLTGHTPSDTFGDNLNSDMSGAAPLQFSPSVSQITEENNNLRLVLKRTEEVLKFKTDEVQSMSESVSLHLGRIQELERSLINSESEVQDLRAKNDIMMKQKDIDNENLNKMQKRLDSTEEKVSELQQKFELKAKENEYLSLKLQEAQSQLSSSLIKIQQLTVDEPSVLSAKFSEIQNENAGLRCMVQDLEKIVEVLNKEKEESSQNFHLYAQQCNGQLSSLSSEVRNLTKENQSLKERNEGLEKTIKDLENNKEPVAINDDTQISQLSSELEALMEKNKELHSLLKERLDDIESLRVQNTEKTRELNQIYSTLQEVKQENLKLLQEREDNNSNQKLLAAMESDKVAAARAVSQNKKLKDQVVELEEAFIRLSHEKLQLTDKLSNETRMRKELELRLKELELHNNHESEPKPSDSTINASGDVEELKNIIRQLENDKTELLSRLNSCNSQKTSFRSNENEEHTNIESSDCKHAEESDENGESENSKLLLQQMEEKVKKTMNEIAALDEEKEKLEHLVLQLQSETETIGEYISLYQTQRMLLKQRNKEKDEQLLQLAKDKEELKSKLSTLNDLVNHLLREKRVDYSTVPEMSEVTDKSSAKELTAETAMKIQTLISEIQSTNLINNQSVAFEHCPCCSGRLITV